MKSSLSLRAFASFLISAWLPVPIAGTKTSPRPLKAMLKLRRSHVGTQKYHLGSGRACSRARPLLVQIWLANNLTRRSEIYGFGKNTQTPLSRFSEPSVTQWKLMNTGWGPSSCEPSSIIRRVENSKRSSRATACFSGGLKVKE